MHNVTAKAGARLLQIVALGLIASGSWAEEKPPVWPRVAGHTGILVPVVAFDNNGTTAIGKNFIFVGLVQGIVFKLDAHWAIDCELVGVSNWVRHENAPDTVQTQFIIAPGVIYDFGPVTAGMVLTSRIGEGLPFNFGFSTIVSKSFPIGGKVKWYVELAFPFSVFSTPMRTTESFAITPISGISY